MINKVGQIMLYVNNQDEALNFWTEKVGFSVISEENNGQGMRWIEIAPTKDAETSIILHNKEFVAKMSPELNLGAPSLMFFSETLDHLHSDLSKKNVKVGEIVDMPFGRVFNFADYEDNYFAVMEKSK
ncbi:VOC family protein [Paenibacillus jamilae]|uniref:VOC family protein n=1 Tax=Paenibacillus jamilae TaxID=114136 RepID=UPI003D2B5530